MRDVYVISSCRTAVGTFGGSLRDVPAADLGATVIAEALKRGNVKGEWLDEVMFGNVLSAAQGQNVARQCMVKAGVPLKVHRHQPPRQCYSLRQHWPTVSAHSCRQSQWSRLTSDLQGYPSQYQHCLE